MKPTRAPFLARLTLAVATTLAVAAPAVAQDDPNQVVVGDDARCRAELAIGMRRYVEQVLRARTKCQNRMIIGEIPPDTDCVTGQSDSKLAKRLAKAQDRLSNVGAACGGVSLTLLGFPGSCPDPNGAPFDTEDFKNCVVVKTDEIVPRLLDYYYPPIMDFFRGADAKCLKGAAVDGGVSYRRTLRARERCLIGQEFRTIDDEVQCRNEILPYGPGTGDELVDRDISRAYIRLLGAIPASCINVQIDELDYQSSCPDPTGGIFTIFDLKDCFFDVNRDEVLNALDIVFPTDPVCGDGRKNGTEECDNGTQNSNTTPNACRANCTNPRCGDSVTDSGEECDDGNSTENDGCSPQCDIQEGPFCGDDEVNQPSEECDDGNLNNNDGCSGLCLEEYCGDDIIQPPREQCDNGVDNANEPDKCRATGPNACRNPFCGDGIEDSSEECDDGNTVSGDGCQADCKNPPIPADCGNGTIEEPDEECEVDTDCDGGFACIAEGQPNECKCAASCPGVGELTLWAGIGRECTTNADCPVGSCEDDGRCHTRTRLDSGWVGLAHDADINDAIRTRGFIDCPGHGPVCGQCNIIGIDPSTRACRCGNNIRTVCSEPFDTASDECPSCVGGASRNGSACASNTDCLDSTQKCSNNAKVCSGNNNQFCSFNADCADAGTGTCTATRLTCSGTKTQTCTTNSDCLFQGTCTGQAACSCYFGAPFPLSSSGTPACILNRFSEDIVGTANVDLGAGQISANLRTVVYLGASTTKPCPTCGGKCSNDATVFCDRNADCCPAETPACGNTCTNMDPVLDDGVRGGICTTGESVGLSCDATAVNTSFPNFPDKQNGGFYSLDCLPLLGSNVSAQGLVIKLTQTTGTSSLTAQVNCDPANPGPLCPCLQCSGDTDVSCNSNADCASQQGSCTVATNPLTRCTTNSECASVNAGPCYVAAQSGTTVTRRCSKRFAKTCSSNADCVLDLGACALSTCTSKSSGDIPSPNQCQDGLCSDIGNGVGECTLGPDETYCDAVVKANGTGILACQSNGDCDASAVGVPAGTCSVVSRRSCFTDPIVATGDPDPAAPLGAATFCVPPTSNPGINGVAGLPGPGRILNQATSKTFCGTSTKQYVPGVGGCLD